MSTRDRVQEDKEDAQRVRDRQVMELLQELRVAITGGQILFGFLLTVPFAQGWTKTSDFQQSLFLITLVSIATATAFFIAPTAAHRLRFHQRDRPFLVAYANGVAIAGLVCLMVAMLSAMLLVTDYVFGDTTAIIATGIIALAIVGLWFVVPLARYRRD